MYLAAAVVLALIAGVAWSAFRGSDGGAAPIDAAGEPRPSGSETLTQSTSPTPEPDATDAPRSYRVEVPQGWRAIGDRSEGDRLYLAKVEGGVYAAVLTVEAREAVALPLERLPDVALAELIARKANPIPVGDPNPTVVGGERAIAYTIRLPRGQQPLMERQVAFQRNGQLFLITFASAPKTFETEAEAFERFLKSWKWR